MRGLDAVAAKENNYLIKVGVN